MKTLILGDGEDARVRAGEILKTGGIVAFPTDTVYGLGAVYTDRAAVRKIFMAKGRDESKPLSILISDISQVDLLAQDVPDEARALMKRFWPGALTIIVKKNDSVPDEVSAHGNTVGIRMPADERTLGIIRSAGLPLAAPSANLSGKRSSVSFEDVMEDLDGRIDAAVDGGSCDLGVASTVLDISNGRIRILREGLITREMIGECAGKAKGE